MGPSVRKLNKRFVHSFIHVYVTHALGGGMLRTHVYVPKYLLNGSLLECTPVTQATQVYFLTETCLSWVSLVEDGDGLGLISTNYF